MLTRRGLVSSLLDPITISARRTNLKRPEILFSPRQPSHHAPPLRDWSALFTEPAAWQPALKVLAAFEFNMGFLDWVAENNLTSMLSFLRKRKIRVGAGVQSIARQKACGIGEGYENPAQLEIIARKFEAVKEHIDYVSLDGPLWTGHYKTEGNGCHLSIPELADAVATNLHEIVAQSPNIKIGQIEPVPSLEKMPDWRDNFDRWREAFKAALGKEVAFLTFDINWKLKDWSAALQSGVSYARSSGIKIGIIYNGTAADVSNVTWTDHAKANVRAVEDELNILPDMAAFFSWNPYPDVLLPSDDANTHTALLKWYAERHP